jgi:hypothetical protein
MIIKETIDRLETQTGHAHLIPIGIDEGDSDLGSLLERDRSSFSIHKFSGNLSKSETVMRSFRDPLQIPHGTSFHLLTNKRRNIQIILRHERETAVVNKQFS